MSRSPAKMNPFPGLRPFTQDEDYLFFGREEQTLELLERLGNHRFVAVVGSSGSGKSSLVRCGLLSELLGGRMLEAGAAWEIAVTHPGGNPLALLTDALLEAGLYDREAEHARENLLATLSRSHFGLVEAVKQADLGGGTNFVLVVDQFEEIFRFHEAGQTQQEAANEFVSLLLEAAAQKEVPIYVVLTMRSDFIGECGQFEGLAEMVNRGEFLIPRLTREQYKRVIEGPIKVAGGQIAPRLLQRLLNDLGQQADQLPCLQHALMRTWDIWAAKGDTEALDLDDYQRVGKMSQALSLHADEIYESLADDQERALCQGIFQALTVEESNSRGIRRPQRLGRLCQVLEVSSGELMPVLNAYRQSGVTFLMPSPEVELTDQTILDISHESLMRVWTRLRQWVEEETQAAGIYHRLSESADLHAQGKAGLYRDPELGIALAWRESKRPNAVWAERYRPGFAPAMRFLEASKQASVAEEQARESARQRELEQAQQLAEAQELRLEQQQRAARRLRKLVAGVAGVALIAGLACVAALFANQRANRLAENARQNEVQAKDSANRAEQSRQETAKALAVVASQKAEVEGSLSKAEAAERLARAAEESGRNLLYTTDMRLAPFVWKDDRTTAEQLRLLLAKHNPDPATAGKPDVLGSLAKPDLRGFEWHYYQHVLEHSAAVFSGNGDSIVDSAFAPTDQLVTLDQNGQVRRWGLGAQDEIEASRRDLPGGPSAQFRALSPDGRLAALARGDKVHLVDTSTGKDTVRIDSADTKVRRLLFSPDSARLVIVDDKIRWLSAQSGDMIASLDQKFDRLESLALSADGMTLAVAGTGVVGNQFSTFHLDVAAKTITPRAKFEGSGGTLSSCALSPDGRRIAVGGQLAGFVFVFDAGTARAIAQNLSAHASPIAAMAFSAKDGKLATADVEGTIKIWMEAQKLNSKSTAFLTLKGHRGPVKTLGFSNDGRRLASGSVDRTARVWDLENAGAAIQQLEDTSDEGSLVARFSSDGLWIASTSGKSVRLWDAATGRLVRQLSAGDQTYIQSLAFSPTDSRLLAVGHGGQVGVSYVVLWDIDSGTELARLPGATELPEFAVDQYSGMLGALEFSPDGKYLVAGFGSKLLLTSASYPNPLRVWDVATRRLIRRLYGHTGFCVSLDFSRDGTLLASGSHDGTAIIWSTTTWKALQTLKNPDQADTRNTQFGRRMVEAVAFSPDAKTLALASRGGSVQLWDVATGDVLAILKGHSNAVASVAFAPDGRTLASSGGDQTVRLWNVKTRRELMQLDSGNVELSQVYSLAFSRDGQKLLVGGGGAAFWSTALPVWNDTGRAAEKLRLLLQSNAGFQSRIRMLSENPGLRAALEKLNSKDRRVSAAIAATDANWHASRKAWPEAAQAFDRLVAGLPESPEDWLRTPGLLRVATAFVNQNRPRDAAALLAGGATRRAADGLPAAEDRVAVGIMTSTDGGQLRIRGVVPGSPASRAGLLPGDVILKVDDTELSGESLDKFTDLLVGTPGTKARLNVRHAGNEKSEVIEVTIEQFVSDTATGELLGPLRTAIDQRIAKEPQNAGLLELRAELAGQWSDTKAQLADFTAAIVALSQEKPDTKAADLARLYGRRGTAYVAQGQWQAALGDYARIVSDATTDHTLLSNQALAQANGLLDQDAAAAWTVLKPTEMKSSGGATLIKLDDDSILATGLNPTKDTYTIVAPTHLLNVAALRLEAMPHESLGRRGPGRVQWGNFALGEISLKAEPLSVAGAAAAVKLKNPYADFEQDKYPVASAVDGNPATGWSINPRVGETHTAVFEIESSLPAGFEAGTKLTITLDFHFGERHAIGRFRLSVSDHPPTRDSDRKRFAAMKLSDPWQKLAAFYRLKGDQKAIDKLVARYPKSAARIGDLFAADSAWPRAVEIYTKGITAATTDFDLLAKRARALEALKNWEAAAADWSRASAGNPDGAKLLAEFTRRLAAVGQVPLATKELAKAQALFEQSLQADPDNDVVASELAKLLLNRVENENATPWTVLQPTEMKSEKGATLTRQGDGSILASGTNSDADVYRVSAVASIDRIAAVRLEALPDASLPNNGPGRHETGNFSLRAFRLEQAQSPSGDGMRPVPFGRAWASYDRTHPDVDIAGTLSESLNKHWDVFGRSGQAHQAVFLLKEPAAGKDRPFLIELRHGANLGRFRLSVCTDLAGLDREESRFAALKANDPWSMLAAGYALIDRSGEAVKYFDRALERAVDAEARQPIVELAARFDDLLRALVERHPDDLQLQLALGRQYAQRGTKRLVQKQPAAAQAELQKSREIFTRLYRVSRWSVLVPTELKSEGGETLTVETDGSIFVSGPNPDRPQYMLKLRTELPALTAIRLETIPDMRLPQGGAGRFANGNFHLAEFTAAIDTGQESATPTPIDFSSAIVDFHADQSRPFEMTDGDPRTYWDTTPRVQEPHWVVLGLKTPVRSDGGYVKVMLDSGISIWGKHGLGRFRLSASNSAQALDQTELRTDLKASEYTDLFIDLATSQAQQGRKSEARSSLTEALQRTTDRADLAKIIATAAPLDGVLEELAERTAGNAQFQAALARHFSERGPTALADASHKNARSLFERKLAQEPENSILAAELAEVLLGPFRPSVKGDPRALELNRHRTAALKLTDSRSKLAAAYFLVGDTEIAADLLARSTQKNEIAQWLELGLPIVGIIDSLEARHPKSFAAALPGLASAAEERGEIELARNLYGRLGRLQPENRLWNERIEKLRPGVLAVWNFDSGPGRWGDALDCQLTANSGVVTARTTGVDPRFSAPATGPDGGKAIVLKYRTDQAFTMKLFWADASGGMDESRSQDFPIPAAASAWREVTLPFWSREGLNALRLDPDTSREHPLEIDSIVLRRLEPENDRDTLALAAGPNASAAAGLVLALDQRAHGKKDPARQAYRKAVAAVQPVGQNAFVRELLRAVLREFGTDGPEADVLLKALEPVRQLALARDLAARGKAALAAKNPALALAELKQAQNIFPRLLPAVADWTVLTPVEMKTETGAKLELQNDGSIFVQEPPRNDTYTLSFETNLKGVKGLRLEALADSRLPSGGPGWSGNFILSELTLEAAPAKSPAQARSIPLRNAIADFSQVRNGEWDVRGAVDGNAATGWAVWPELRMDHTAVFEVAEELGDGQTVRLTVRLSHRSSYEKHWLGRFRLSFTSDPTVLQNTGVRLDLKAGELVEFYAALGRAHVEQGQTNEAAAAFAQLRSLTEDRGAPDAMITAAAPLAGVLEKLAELESGDAKFQAGLARHFADTGEARLAGAALARARTLFEQQLAAESANTDAALGLADVLLFDTNYWTILKPAEMTSRGGETLTLEKDGSIFVSGPRPDRALYTFKLRTDLPALTAIRLETIPDARLLAGGAGRGDNGNFHLAEFTAAVVAGNSAGESTPIVISRVFADFPDGDSQSPAFMLDGNPRTIWDTFLKTRTAHCAVFGLKSPAKTDGGFITVTLDSGITPWGPHGLGRFRLSASADPAALERDQKRIAILKLSDPWAKLAAAYHSSGDRAALDRLLERHTTATAGIGDLNALDEDWDRALTQYNKAITPKCTDARVFAARAQVHEKLGHWELAAVDWGNSDLHSSDKSVRVGNPSFPYLEHRARIHGRLRQFDQQVQDYTELLKPERLGDNAWIVMARGEAYGQLRQWSKARTDIDRAISLSRPEERGTFQFVLARHFAAQGLWQQAADETREVYRNPTDINKEWWALRDSALIYAIVGDVESYRKAAVECYRKEAAANHSQDVDNWTVLVMLLFPDMITKENRPHLMELAAKADANWKPGLTAAIEFRSGDCKKAAESFDSGGAAPQFLFLAALTHHKLGNQELAKKRLEQGNSWVRAQCAKDPGAGVPRDFSWHDWSHVLSLQTEAIDRILGPAAGASRKLVLQGQTVRAALAYAKELADASDKSSRSRIMDELAQFGDVLTALHRRLRDNLPIQEAYRRMVEKTAGANATAAGELLDALDHLRRGEKDEARKAYRKAAAAIRPVGESAFARDVAREALREFGPIGPEAEALLTALSEDPPAALAQAIQNQPDQPAGYLARSGWYGERGVWRKTLDDLSATYRLRPEAYSGMQLAISLAWFGEADRYRDHCRNLVDRFAGTQDPLDAERTLKTCCLLGPAPVGDPTRIAGLAKVAASADPSQPLFVWLELARALYEYRTGKFAAALATSRANRTRIQAVGTEDPAIAMVFTVEALALYSTGDAAGARRSLGETKKLIDEKFLALLGGELGYWHDWLAAELLYREAEALLETKTPEPKK
jgi:WD40 repeat protein/tetratricopeptide (TPR) repeat protein